jgi:hypothetical protein
MDFGSPVVNRRYREGRTGIGLNQEHQILYLPDPIEIHEGVPLKRGGPPQGADGPALEVEFPVKDGKLLTLIGQPL